MRPLRGADGVPAAMLPSVTGFVGRLLCGHHSKPARWLDPPACPSFS